MPASAPARNDAADLLRGAGLRITPQRRAILAYLLGTDRHPSAEQVGLALGQHRKPVSRASVYNVLHTLTEAGLVREVFAGEAVTRFDANLEAHQHFVCRTCGRIEDIPLQPPVSPGDAAPGTAAHRTPAASSSAPGMARALGGRKVESQEVIYRGQCAACAGAGASAARPGAAAAPSARRRR